MLFHRAIILCFFVRVYSKFAIIEFILLKNSVYESHHVQGMFADFGATINAEGHILKISNTEFCTTDGDVTKEYGWVGVIHISEECENERAASRVVKSMVDNGATALLFNDVANLNVFGKQRQDFSVNRPVVIVTKSEAAKMTALLKNESDAFVRIKFMEVYLPSTVVTHSNEYFDMGIFMAFFIMVSIICMAILIKIKFRQKRKRSSLTRTALQSLRRMEVKKYPRSNDVTDENRLFGLANCVVCLEPLTDGKDVRVLPCKHEFHRGCVDPWLMRHYTCPLCMFVILGGKKCGRKAPRRLPLSCLRAVRYNSDEENAVIVTHGCQHQRRQQFREHAGNSSEIPQQISVQNQRGENESFRYMAPFESDTNFSGAQEGECNENKNRISKATITSAPQTTSCHVIKDGGGVSPEEMV